MGHDRSVAAQHVLCIVMTSSIIRQLSNLLSLAGAASTAVAASGSSLDDKIKQRVQARQHRGSSKYTPEVARTSLA